MISTFDLRGESAGSGTPRGMIPRASTSTTDALAGASELIDDVRARGLEALLDQSERFDGVRPRSVRVPRSEIDRAVAHVQPEVRAALEESIRRLRISSEATLPTPVSTELGEGATVSTRWQPVERVGLYVPGGQAVYPSSVVMNVVPAQVAGVRSLALASPAQREHGGGVHPTILAAAGMLGVEEVYAMGGAGAIGAFAYGVDAIELAPVDLITGPGNVWVAAAKRVVRGVVGIDAEAGPTEILIIADDDADPKLIAADLISQAEHDELAAAILVTDSDSLAQGVRVELERMIATTESSERVRAALGAEQSAIVLVPSLKEAAEFSNAYGPEHLELHVRDPEAALSLIESAGAIFLGPNSPVSLGDYLAGSNHVLPTRGQARFAPGLGVHTFLRPQQVVRYDRRALEAVTEHIVALATTEGLPAHADAATARFRHDQEPLS